MATTGVPELSALIAEYESLDRSVEPQRCRELLLGAIELVDRTSSPKKWAALRQEYAKCCGEEEPEAAIAAYRDALAVWDPEQDRTLWCLCRAGLGYLLATRFPPGSDEGEEAIEHLTAGLEEEPWAAGLLGVLYGLRPIGDPAENWQKQVQYLTQARQQISRDEEPQAWAKVTNELACAYGAEPVPDYTAPVEKQVELHLAALAVLHEGDPRWAETCLHLGTAYLNRPSGNPADNAATAEQHLQRARGSCGDNKELEVRVLLMLGRQTAFHAAKPAAERLRDALAIYEQARDLAINLHQPALLGSGEKLRAIVYLELLRLGEAEWIDAAVASCDAALRSFDPATFLGERRQVLQIKAEAFFEAGDLSRAAATFEDATIAAETLIDEATTTNGRLERIWQLRDSTGLLAYCRLKNGDFAAAVEALERGKTLLWDRGEGAAISLELIPEGGALLLPVFAAATEGAVILAMRGEDGPAFASVWLPHFGKERVLELQRGPDPDKELGGWQLAYCFRRSQPELFRAEIEQLGGILWDEFWQPVLAKLEELGIAPGAELVWFPHAGSGPFPMHAAWRMENGVKQWFTEKYALRYAPSLKTLAKSAGRVAAAPATLLVSNPGGDLPFTELEAAWVQQTTEAVQHLSGAAATEEKVVQALASATRVHLATHAEFHLDDPLQSSVMLAGGERLTLQEFTAAADQHPLDFVVLSGCETAMSRVTSMADEFLGFPAALLSHGARVVLASQWWVDDAATAFLMSRFYKEHARAGTTAAEALRQAQNWLRAVTNAELSQLLGELTRQPGQIASRASRIRTSFRGRVRDEQPFAHPFYWAAFTVSGGST